MSLTHFGVPESAYAKRKWATTWYYDRWSTLQTVCHARKKFLLDKNITLAHVGGVGATPPEVFLSYTPNRFR